MTVSNGGMETSDAAARRRIASDLDTNLLVEAGAGSGKTTSLVERMISLVLRGTPVERIAAVTFTRKATSELRERFQIALESRLRDDAAAPQHTLLENALHELDRGFIGTIHAFCARLLREHPLELGLDPAFVEVIEEDWTVLREEFWRRWLERAWVGKDEQLRKLRALGIDSRELGSAFKEFTNNPDVEFPFEDAPAPEIDRAREQLEGLLIRAWQLMPREEPEKGWDDLMKIIRRLHAHRKVRDWSEVVSFCEALAILDHGREITQKRWSSEKAQKQQARALAENFDDFMSGEGGIALRKWREHRYAPVMRVLRSAARDFRRERFQNGRLGFTDLLMLAARLLREFPDVRDELGARYAHLLVDEFQDTDPIQAEVCFLLASSSSEGPDWRKVKLRDGGLFVVGDPKQSIYRFRRADIQVYELVKSRIAECGDVLELTQNFRSSLPIAQFVNSHFSEQMPARASSVQAAFAPMNSSVPSAPGDGVHFHIVSPARTRTGNREVYELDSAAWASLIAERVGAGECSPGDFLILTPRKHCVSFYAAALAEHNIPATTTGAGVTQEEDLRELLIVLDALADPENPVAVAAALEGLFCGLHPGQLYDANQRGIRLSLTRAAPTDDSPVSLALSRLHEWWIISQRQSPDVLVERILADSGLLFHAASQPLGDARAGALLYLVRALRQLSLADAPGLNDAIARARSLLDSSSADAPLMIGRTDAVRVMNLHQAKGLEANVVILAAPASERDHPPRLHVSRGQTGATTGGMLLCSADQNGNVLAQPVDWENMELAEKEFASAETVRLLYVATTRARRQLLVAQWRRGLSNNKTSEDKSIWRPLDQTLQSHASRLSITLQPAKGREKMQRGAQDLHAASAEAAERVQQASRQQLIATTVTKSAKEERELARDYDVPLESDGAPRGAAWGRAVHRSMEALGRGRRGSALRSWIAAVAAEEGLAGQEELLWETVRETAESEAWRRLTSNGAPLTELPVMQATTGENATVTLVQGVIDAAARGKEGWTVVDWKTDAVTGNVWRSRLERYLRQVETYARILSEITGQPAEARVEHVRVSSDG